MYDYLVQYETDLTAILPFFHKPGFMIDLFTIYFLAHNESNKRYPPFVKRHFIMGYEFLTLHNDNVQAADKLCALISDEKLAKKANKLLKLYSELLHQYKIEALKLQNQSRYLNNDDNVQQIKDYNIMVDKTRNIKKSIKAIHDLPARLKKFIVKSVPSRNKRFVDEYPFLLDQ